MRCYNVGDVCFLNGHLVQHRYNGKGFNGFRGYVNDNYYPRSKHSKVNFEYKQTVREDPFEYAVKNYNLQVPRVIQDTLDNLEEDADDAKKTKVTLPFIANENQFVPPQEFNDTAPRPKSKGPDAITIDPSIIFQTPHEEHIVVGVIGSPYGLKGHVKIKSLTVNPLLWLCKPGFRYVKNLYDDRTLPIKIVQGKRISPDEIYSVKFEGINCSEHALRLKGCYLTTQLENVPPLEEDCYYSQDLLQCDVYLFNDASKTLLGKSVDFLHRTRFVTTKKCADLTEDLLDVEMNIQISLETLINLTKNRHVNENAPKGVGIVTERDLASAHVVDAAEEFQNEDMSGVQYVKFYTCSKCSKEFTNYDEAIAHDLAGCNDDAVEAIGSGQGIGGSQVQANTDPTIRITNIDEVTVAKLKHPVRRFYIPLIKNETIRCVDAPNKSIYIDPTTIFIGEDGR